jgi:hypothetical protein
MPRRWLAVAFRSSSLIMTPGAANAGVASKQTQNSAILGFHGMTPPSTAE